MAQREFFYRMSNGIRVTVRPLFLDDRSDPDEQQFVFAYFVRIENVGKEDAHLLRRRWLIHDSIGEGLEVEGEGVVGEQPIIQPKTSFRYTSGAVLDTPVGSMQGSYQMLADDGTGFDALIAAFTLSVPQLRH